MVRLQELLYLLSVAGLVTAADLPCSPRAGDPGQGQICVCNSTYCDTIARPTRLPPRQYHLYTTSNSTPGFTHTTGAFQYEAHFEGEEDIVFTINSTIKYQEIRGFGGSFSDSFGMVMDSLPDGAQYKLIESYFGPTGIEYTFCRTVIGSSDFSNRSYNYDDVPGDKYLKNFSLTQEDYSYKIPNIQKAQAVSLRGVEVYACSWNAPQWMKTKIRDSEDLTGYLSLEYYQTFADYIIKFVKAYKENGIDIWAVSEGNEPLLALFMGVSMNLTATMAHQQKFWVRDYLVPSLRAANLSDVKFIALDDMKVYAIYWMERFADDPHAYEAVDSIGLHWYLDYFIPPSFLDSFHRRFPEKKIYYTESSINVVFGTLVKPVVLGSWNRGALYMYNIIENLNHWTSGYIDWNLALNTEGGPSLSLLIDAAVIVNETSQEFYKQPIFYGIGHFSKFIPPGSRRVYVKSNQNLTTHEEYNRHQNMESIMKFLRERSENPVPYYPAVTAPPVVMCVATANSDGSHTAVVLNNKNVTALVRLEVPEVGSITLNLEEHSINSFVYWLD